MSNLKSWTSPESGSVLARNHRKAPHGALLAANTRAQSELGLPTDSVHQDLRGQTLRLLRMQQNWDPAILATQACISIRQLYQLECGETSLFYSQSLRNQAGRRVATILGAQWDALEQTTPPTVQDKHLKLVSTTAAETPAMTTFSEGKSPTALPTSSATTPNIQPSEVPMGLNKPAVDTLVVPTPVTAQISRPDQTTPSYSPPPRKLHPLWTLIAWLLAALAGAGTGWVLAVFWGLRL